MSRHLVMRFLSSQGLSTRDVVMQGPVVRALRLARTGTDATPPDRRGIVPRHRPDDERIGFVDGHVGCRDAVGTWHDVRRSAAAEPRPGGPRDRGSAIVDFALVGGLLTLLFAAVLQLTLALHVRNTLVDCAAEGARFAATADRSPADGVDRARELIAMTLAPRFAETVSSRELVLDGVRVIEVEVIAPVPVIGLIGPSGTMTVTGHALEESP